MNSKDKHSVAHITLFLFLKSWQSFPVALIKLLDIFLSFILLFLVFFLHLSSPYFLKTKIFLFYIIFFLSTSFDVWNSRRFLAYNFSWSMTQGGLLLSFCQEALTLLDKLNQPFCCEDHHCILVHPTSLDLVVGFWASLISKVELNIITCILLDHLTKAVVTFSVSMLLLLLMLCCCWYGLISSFTHSRLLVIKLSHQNDEKWW